jgi:hypothetical protein
VSFKGECDKLECLLEALNPELFPGTPLCAQTRSCYARAITESEYCKHLADGFKDRLAKIRVQVLRPQASRKEVANRLFIEVTSGTFLWNEALDLIDACEAWSSKKEPARETQS